MERFAKKLDWFMEGPFYWTVTIGTPVMLIVQAIRGFLN